MTPEPSILVGDCIHHMRKVIPPASVHCIVSSPPYWALRDYGIPGRDWLDGWHGVYGNEPDYRQYIVHTLELFEAMGRVLRPDGVIWWNIGDCYVGDSKLLMPDRVAIALMDAGWCIRQDAIWDKPSPMPESIAGWSWERCRVKSQEIIGQRIDLAMEYPIPSGWNTHHVGDDLAGRHTTGKRVIYTDCPGCPKCQENGGFVLRKSRWRNTTAHEHIFQITRPGAYYADAVAAAEPVSGDAHARGHGQHRKSCAPQQGIKQNTSFSTSVRLVLETRNPRSVWKIASESYKGAHFATFPSEIPYRCILASTSARGCCPHCGSQWAPVIVKDRQATRPGADTKVNTTLDLSAIAKGLGTTPEHLEQLMASSPEHAAALQRACQLHSLVIGNRDPQRHVTSTKILDYRPTCQCPAHEPIPATVYEPFGGSGTTAQVAHHMGRRAIISEVNPDYVELQRQRIAERPRCLIVRDKATKPKRTRKTKRGQLSLWPK